MNDSIKLIGEFAFEHFNLKGKLIEKRVVKNLIVNKGKEAIARLICGDLTASPTFRTFTHVGIGTGTTVAAEGDLQLGTEVARIAATPSTGTKAYEADYKAKYTVSWTNSGSTRAITEAGIFDGATAGPTNSHMLSHQVFDAITINNGETLNITWRVSVS